MTDDKKRLEDIRDYIKHGKDRDPTYADDGEVAFLLDQIDKRDEVLRALISSVEHYANIGLIGNFCVAEDECLSDVVDKAREALGEK